MVRKKLGFQLRNEEKEKRRSQKERENYVSNIVIESIEFLK